MFVSLRGLVALFRRNLRRLLAPALVNGLQTPFGAAPRGADRLVASGDEDRIGVRRSGDAQRDPTAALDPGVERDVAHRAVGDDLLFIHRRSVDDQFDHHFARRSDARAFQIPVRLLVETQLADRFVRLFVQPRGHTRRHMRGSRLIQLHFALLCSSQPNEAISKLRLNQKPYWDLERARIGTSREVMVELIVNGTPVDKKKIVADGAMRDIAFDARIERSSWVALRIAASSHTNPIFVTAGDKAIRASRRSAEWCLKAVDQCWSQKAPKISAKERDEAAKTYEHARQTYRRILAESEID